MNLWEATVAKLVENVTIDTVTLDEALADLKVPGVWNWRRGRVHCRTLVNPTPPQVYLSIRWLYAGRNHYVVPKPGDPLRFYLN